MQPIKKILRTPYPYIFLLSYLGIWTIWDYIKIPARTPPPDGIISYLPTIHYNPLDNILRFLAAIIVPPTVCLAYWWFSNNPKQLQWLKNNNVKRLLASGVVLMATLLALGMGMVSSSTNPANNQPDIYGPHKYFLVDTFHEGETLGPEVSYDQKNLKPYSNFVIVHGVFQDPLRTEIAFKLFGRSIGAERTFTAILTMLVFVCYFGLLLVLFRGNLIKSAIGLVVLGVLILPDSFIPHLDKLIVGVQLPFRDIATIGFLASAVLGFRYQLAKRSRPLVISAIIIGFLVTAGFANSVDRAIYISALSVLWCLMQWLMRGGRPWLKLVLAPYLAGFAAGLVVLAIALKGDFSGIISYLSAISRYKDYLDGQIFLKPGTAISLVLLVLSAMFGIGLFWLVSFIRTSPKDLKESLLKLKTYTRQAVVKYHTEILLGATALIFMRSAIGRADLGHFNYSVQWIYLFLAYLLINYLFALKKHQELFNFMGVMFLIFMFLFYTAQVKELDLAANTFPLHVPDSQLVLPDYLQTANYLKANLHGQDTFVTLTSEGIWYYLVDKPSPIQYPIIWYAFTGPQRASIANSIADNPHIKYIITNDNWTSDFDFVPNPQRFPEVYNVLDNDYTPKVGFGQQTIWQRK